ncbi:MAG: HDIG domain-containing metalloprotein [Chloroflexota bacterium]
MVIFRTPFLKDARQRLLLGILLVSASILAYLALIQPWSLRQEQLPILVGDVAPQDLSAPRDIQYVSQVRTDEARAAAERAVEPVYGPADPAVARIQVDGLTSVLLYISGVRIDEFASLDQKRDDLSLVQGIQLDQETSDALLALSQNRWEAIRVEALNLLARVMQSAIRSEDLESVRQSLPSRVTLSLTEGDAEIVVALVSPLVTANSFYSPDLTDTTRQEARAYVEPVIQSYVEGQTIVARGQIIKAADFEALTQLGLVSPEDPGLYFAGAAALVAISAVFNVLYFLRQRSPLLNDLRRLIMLAILFLIFLYAARISLPNRTVIPYLFPIPAFGLLMSALFGIESGIVYSLLLSVLATYGMPDGLGLLPYYLLPSLCGVLALGRARRLGQFLYAGVAISAVGMAVLVAYRLPFGELDVVGMATLAGAAIFAGVAAASIALPLQYVLAQFLGLTTALQLLEISRPDSALLKYFLQRAPGTYQHSLQVANLAEQAAEAIGADGLLARVGALFHDVGKSVDPLFFVENQPTDQINSHDDLDPGESAATIIRHVTDGLTLARKYRLPQRVIDFISEHHGTLITSYQYNHALERVGGVKDAVNKQDFRYPGPNPRSRETAILMFSDSVEARARANRPKNDDEMRAIVRDVIDRCQREGQLDDTPLTQRELTRITESFVTTLRVTYHPRLEYPRDERTSGTDPDAPTHPIFTLPKRQ